VHLASRRRAGGERPAVRGRGAIFAVGIGVLCAKRRLARFDAAGERATAALSFNDLPDLDSELFEQVTDDELALLDYYRALRPAQRAALLEALVRMVEPAR
jgi:hypothetical protein